MKDFIAYTILAVFSLVTVIFVGEMLYLYWRAFLIFPLLLVGGAIPWSVFWAYNHLFDPTEQRLKKKDSHVL